MEFYRKNLKYRIILVILLENTFAIAFQLQQDWIMTVPDFLWL